MTSSRRLRLRLLEGRLGICRLLPEGPLPEWAAGDAFFSITRTEDEISVVCAEERIPEGIMVERGWRCIKLEGPFDFSQTGILASLTQPLAEASVSIVAISTYDTDYLLVKERDLETALAALRSRGHLTFP